MKDSAAFWNKAAAKYAKSDIGDMAAYEHTLERTRSFLSAGDRVLEVGCGTGSTALLLAPSVAELVGSDISEEMIAIARGKAEEAGVENLSFEVSSAEAVSAKGEAYDAVLGFNLVHLLDDPAALIESLHGSLKAGGVFISKTVCLGDPSLGFKRFLFGMLIPVMQMFGKAPNVHSLTRSELDEMITAAGFEIVEVGNFPAMSRYVVARKLA